MFFFLYIFIYIYSMCRKCLVVVEVLLAVLPMLFEMFFHTSSHDILPEEDASNGTEYTKKKKKKSGFIFKPFIQKKILVSLCLIVAIYSGPSVPTLMQVHFHRNTH